MSYGYPQPGYPGPQPPNRTPQILAIVAIVVALVAAGVVGFLFLRGSDNDDEPVAQTPGVVTVIEQEQSSPSPGETTTVVPPTVTTTVAPGPESVPVAGADDRGFLSGPRCHDAADPAMFIGQTARSRVVICQVGAQTGRYYYLGYAGGKTIEVGYPTRSGSTFTAVNGATRYIVSPSSLVITQNGATVATEPMVQSWVR